MRTSGNDRSWTTTVSGCRTIPSMAREFRPPVGCWGGWRRHTRVPVDAAGPSCSRCRREAGSSRRRSPGDQSRAIRAVRIRQHRGGGEHRNPAGGNRCAGDLAPDTGGEWRLRAYGNAVKGLTRPFCHWSGTHPGSAARTLPRFRRTSERLGGRGRRHLARGDAGARGLDEFVFGHDRIIGAFVTVFDGSGRDCWHWRIWRISDVSGRRVLPRLCGRRWRGRAVVASGFVG